MYIALGCFWGSYKIAIMHAFEPFVLYFSDHIIIGLSATGPSHVIIGK